MQKIWIKFARAKFIHIMFCWGCQPGVFSPVPSFLGNHLVDSRTLVPSCLHYPL